jgi:citrate synthase
MGWSTADRIVVRGLDLPGEILGRLNLGDMAFLELTGRVPNANESRMFNALVVTLVEHGSRRARWWRALPISARPKRCRPRWRPGFAASAACSSARPRAARGCCSRRCRSERERRSGALATRIVAEHRAREAIVPGLGHPIHKPIDPRVPRLFEIARETGFHGKYVELIQLVQAEAERAAKRSLPLNATGAIGALGCEMGLDWKVLRGLGVMARAIGLVGHLLEESRQPMAQEVWLRTESEASAHNKPKEP